MHSDTMHMHAYYINRDTQGLLTTKNLSKQTRRAVLALQETNMVIVVNTSVLSSPQYTHLTNETISQIPPSLPLVVVGDLNCHLGVVQDVYTLQMLEE